MTLKKRIRKGSTDPTNNYQKQIKDKNHLKFIKPMVPKLRVQPKLHKPDHPIRSIVNFKNSPGYKFFKYLEHIIKREINLQLRHNVKNTQEYDNIKIEERYTSVSFDYTNVYNNVPVKETIKILKNNNQEQHLYYIYN